MAEPEYETRGKRLGRSSSRKRSPPIPLTRGSKRVAFSLTDPHHRSITEGEAGTVTKSRGEIEQYFSDHPEWAERASRFCAIRTFYLSSILPPGYDPPPEMADAITLTDAGRAAADSVEGAILSTLSDAQRSLVMLSVFAWDEMYIDPQNSDLPLLVSLTSQELRSLRVRHPFTFRSPVQGRFYELFSPNISELSADQTACLLETTEQGVSHVGPYTAGPIGVVESLEWRDFEPSTVLPVGPCDDPGCMGIHQARLTTAQTVVGEAYTNMISSLRRTHGQRAAWRRVAEAAYASEEAYYRDFNPKGLPWFIGNAFALAELCEIIRYLLEEYPARLRPILPPDIQTRGSAQAIAHSLTHAETIQILLLATDEQIVVAIETAIAASAIDIPVTEVRSPPVFRRDLTGWLAQVPECSRLGVRLVAGRRAEPPGTSLAIPRLQRLLMVLHGDENGLADLEWQLLATAGANVFEKLANLAQTANPRDVVRLLVLARPALFDGMKRYLRYGKFRAPQSPADLEHLIDRVLWKIGFDVREFPDAHQRFWARMSQLADVVRESPIDTELRREEVRSVAVNLLVSIEEILDESLAFTTWSLLFDHYGTSPGQRFRFNLQRSRRWAFECINSRVKNREDRGEEAMLDPLGKNTLYPLLHGFADCADILEGEADKASQDSALRSPARIARYHFFSGLYQVPFLHTFPVCDVAAESVRRITSLLRDVPRVLHSANLLGVRNRIPHGGGDFPAQEDFLSVLAALEHTVRLLEVSGASPTVHQFAAGQLDQYGRYRAVLRDYASREVNMASPSPLRSCGLPSSEEPQVVFHWATLRDSPECLRFSLEEDSPYARMWQGFQVPEFALSSPDAMTVQDDPFAAP